MNDKPAQSPEKEKPEAPETSVRRTDEPDRKPETKAAPAAGPEKDDKGKPERKKTEKKTFAAVLAGAAIVVLMVFAIFNKEDLTKIYVERLASRTLNVEVSIGALAFSTEERRVTVRNLRVANPEGFTQPYAMAVEGVDIYIESLENNQLILSSVVTGNANVLLETNKGRTNLIALHKNINRVAAADIDGKPAEESRPLGVAIRLVEIGRTNMYMSLEGAEPGRPVALPKLQITEIGGGQGILASEAIAQLVDQLARHVFAEAIKGGYLDSALPPEAMQEIKDRLALGYIDQAREAMEKFGIGVRNMMDRRR